MTNAIAKSSIRRNANGTRNLTDLRKALAADDSYSIRRQGGSWIVSRYSEAYGCWLEIPQPHSMNERQIIEEILFGEHESSCEHEYHRKQAAKVPA
jgi:hypothetical protein